MDSELDIVNVLALSIALDTLALVAKIGEIENARSARAESPLLAVHRLFAVH